MIAFVLNGETRRCAGEGSLLDVLRNELGVTSVKDGCSAEGTCGACLVEIDGKPALWPRDRGPVPRKRRR